MQLDDTLALAADLTRRLRFGGRRMRLILVGSARRGAARNTDVDFLVVPKRPLGAAERAALFHDVSFANADANAKHAEIARRAPGALPEGARRRSFDVTWPRGATAARRRVQVDLFFVQPDELPFALFHYTGSREYNIRTRAHAKARGWRLNQYGLFDAGGRRVRGSVALRTERELAALLGVSYRAPTDREK
jgi:DNA polymerase/3'-5' exonuclease PolX